MCLSLSWLCAVPLDQPPQPAVWAVLAVSALASSVYAFRKVRIGASWRFFAVLAAPSAVAAVFVPVPYSFGPALLLAGCLVAILGTRGEDSRRSRRLTSAGAGIAFAGAIASVQAAAIAPYVALTSRYGEPGFLGVVAVPLLRLLGVHVRTGAAGLFLDSGTRTLTYSLTTGAFAVFVPLVFAVGAVPVLVIARRDRFAFPILLLLLFVYAELRFVVVALMFAASGRIELFWSIGVTILTFLPLPAVVSALLRTAPPREIEPAEPRIRSRSFWLVAALTCVAVVALLGSIAFESPGVRKAGRVLIDEGHSDWEWTAKPLDTEWYGERSGYNYYNLYQYLNLFYRMQRNTKPITDQVLADCDVLIVKMPTTALSPEEVEAIVGFVRKGGGLFLIGDHTNVFGTSSNINPLADRFGLHFEPVAQYDLTSGHLSEYHAPKVLPHPIVQNLPETFLFATSSTLRLSPDAKAAIVGYGLRSLKADYSQENFFAADEAAQLPEFRFGPMVQGAAVRYGRGRVAAFADSTVFSNFWLFVPGKSELALSYVEWLDRTNTAVDARLLLAALALGSAVAVGIALSRSRSRTLALAVCAGMLIGVPSGIHFWGAIQRSAYPLPRAHTKYTRISFDRQYSRFTSPSTAEGFYAGPQESLHTFYMWNQRLGYVPSMHDSLKETLAAGDVVVVANPSGSPSRADMAGLSAFVERGGRLLVLAGSSDATSSARAFLEPFGLEVERGPLSTPAYTPKGGDPLRFTAKAGRVIGGTALVSTDASEAVCAYARKGRGLVVAFSDPHLFTSASMGNESSVPDAQQREIGNLEFALMRFLAQDKEFTF